MFENKIKEQLSNSHSIDSFKARDEDYPLHKVMVGHDHNRIKTQGKGKVSDEIHQELFEGQGNRGQDRTKQRNGRMCVNLILLANSTASNEMLDKGGEAWSREVTLKDRFGVENAHVTQEGGRVDGMEESRVCRGRNIHTIAKIKVSIVK